MKLLSRMHPEIFCILSDSGHSTMTCCSFKKKRGTVNIHSCRTTVSGQKPLYVSSEVIKETTNRSWRKLSRKRLKHEKRIMILSDPFPLSHLRCCRDLGITMKIGWSQETDELPDTQNKCLKFPCHLAARYQCVGQDSLWDQCSPQSQF